MFVSILVETGLYITKSSKSDLITQKAHRQQKATQQQSFDQYFAKMQTAKPATPEPQQPARQTADEDPSLKNRHERPAKKQQSDAKESLSKKDK